MRIGRLYRVIGIPAHVHQWPGITWSVEANSVEPWEPESKAVNDLTVYSDSCEQFSYFINNIVHCCHTELVYL